MPCFRYLWQMLLPYVLADVMSNFVEDVTTCCLKHLQQVCRLMLLPVADGIATAG